MTTTPPLGAALSGPAVSRQSVPRQPVPRQPVPRQVQLPQPPARPVTASRPGRTAPLPAVPRQLPHELPRQGRRLSPVPQPPRSDLAAVPQQDVVDLIPVADAGDGSLVVLGHPVPTSTDQPDPVGPPRRVVFWRGTTRWLRQAIRP